MGRTFRVIVCLTVFWSAAAQAQRLPPPNVPGTWDQQFQTYDQTYYGGQKLTLPGMVQQIGNVGFYFGLGLFLDPTNPVTAQRLADGCKAAHPGDTWQQIHCAAVETNLALAHRHYDSSGKGPWLTSDCRDHAMLFAMIFSDLHLPDSTAQVGYLDLGNHVVNKVTVNGENGLPYSYIVDTQIPDNFYPYGPNAQAYYQAHKNDPLPAIGTGGFDPLVPLVRKIPWVGSFIGRAMSHFNPFSIFSGLSTALNPARLLNRIPVVGGLFSFFDHFGSDSVIAAPETENWGPAFFGATDTPGYSGVRVAKSRGATAAAAAAVGAAIQDGLGQAR